MWTYLFTFGHIVSYFTDIFALGKDQGQNVREKAKQLVNLLKDDERLKNERARALKAKERFAQSASAFGSDGGLDTPTSPKYPAFRGDWSTSRDSGFCCFFHKFEYY